MDIGQIEIVPIKEVWKYEDKHFTPWLKEHIEVLSSKIGVKLIDPETEVSTGNFFVDIKTKDIDGNVVIVENQYGGSNHDHLGKLLTYQAAFDAKIAIWIVEEARAEHIAAIKTLNDSFAGCDFYLLKLEAVKIGDSKPAPLITKIVGPDESSKQAKVYKTESSESQDLKRQFWHVFIEQAGLMGYSSFASLSDTWNSYLNIGAGVSGILYQCWTTKQSMRIELRFDKKTKEENRVLYNKILAKRAEIEAFMVGHKVQWEDSDDYKMCAVRIDINNGGYAYDSDKWPAITKEALQVLKNLEKSTRHLLK
ncbi:MAG: DUF4268 domain-containing protein [Bacteroidales bacterium]|nr:DUF4268 domain-containing protein [Bacteroidales bacterium]